MARGVTDNPFCRRCAWRLPLNGSPCAHCGYPADGPWLPLTCDCGRMRTPYWWSVTLRYCCLDCRYPAFHAPLLPLPERMAGTAAASSERPVQLSLF